MQQNHPLRIFFVSGLITLVVLGIVLFYLGVTPAILTLVLIVIELTFSFDNAIVNARILESMSRFWQQMFLTIGVVIAVFGMRVVFPVVIVMLSSGLGWSPVVDLALHHHEQYAHVLLGAHDVIASFGGMFLLMLSLFFLFDPTRDVHWLEKFERKLQRFGHWTVPLGISLTVLAIVTLLHDHSLRVAEAGALGILTYGIIHGFSTFFEKRFESSAGKVVKSGVAGLIAFLYLQVLDASFSLDGVVGAFAITKDVVLIAAGLGVGALWVRSLTIHMVRRGTLGNYRYLEHGAYYTIGVLSLMLLTSLFIEVPQAITGGVSVLIIAAAVVTSVREKNAGTA